MKMKFCVLLGVMMAASPAFAIDLASARAQGLVCEKTDGMLSAKASTTEVKALVDSVNAGRSAEYQRIAASKGQTASVVGQITAKELIGKGNAACR